MAGSILESIKEKFNKILTYLKQMLGIKKKSKIERLSEAGKKFLDKPPDEALESVGESISQGLRTFKKFFTKGFESVQKKVQQEQAPLFTNYEEGVGFPRSSKEIEELTENKKLPLLERQVNRLANRVKGVDRLNSTYSKESSLGLEKGNADKLAQDIRKSTLPFDKREELLQTVNEIKGKIEKKQQALDVSTAPEERNQRKGVFR